MYTIRPTDRKGSAVVEDEHGAVIGTAFVRASKSEPGFVSIVTAVDVGKAFRVPADWIEALDKLSEPV